MALISLAGAADVGRAGAAGARRVILDPSRTSGSYEPPATRSFTGVRELPVISMFSGRTSVRHLTSQAAPLIQARPDQDLPGRPRRVAARSEGDGVLRHTQPAPTSTVPPRWTPGAG